MKNQWLQFNHKHHLIEQGDKIIIGVSGGMDSVCLLHLLHAIKSEFQLSLYVLHVHHGIRGEEADRDALFVKKMADEMELPFCLVKKNVPEIAQEQGLTEEEAGRNVRYEALEQYRIQVKADKIAVAHHQDDQAETVLFQLFRGTGPRGLAGIPLQREHIIRPLMFANRAEIELYVKNNHLEYCQDETNLLTTYARNKIRLQMIPFAEREINAQAGKHIAAAAERMMEWRNYIEKMGESAFERCVKREENGWWLDTIILGREDPVIRGEVFRNIMTELLPGAKDISKRHYEALEELAEGATGKRIHLPGRIMAEKKYDQLYLYKREQNDVADRSIEIACEVPCQHRVKMDGISFDISMKICDRKDLPVEIPQKDYTKWFDYDKIKNGLVLRNPRNGDFFMLNDKGQRKKLSRYYMDQKLPCSERKNQIVLADESHVVWALPGRISEAYKVKERTKKVLVITTERTPS